MNKIIQTFIFAIFFIPSVAFAGACPMLESDIDNKISELDQAKHQTLISIALTLKEEGVKAHDSGNHAMSEELLNGALRLLEI